MFSKLFSEITIEDIENLVTKRKERENNYLEYKEALGNSDRDKKEFLKDVSGIANSSGGYLFIGITESDGLPQSICGIDKTLGDQKVEEWINNVLISNIDERLRYEIKVFSIVDEKVVIAMYMPESYKKPHMVTFQGRNTYYLRHNVSVNSATQSEVKEMFEYTKKNMSDFEELLKKRRIFDEDIGDFGVNNNVPKLFSDLPEETGIKEKPFILFSFIPKYLNGDRVDTISNDFLEWIKSNSSGFSPAPHVRLFEDYQRIINLDGIVFPRLLPQNEGDPEQYYYYFEVLNNGFFESGGSEEFFWNHGHTANPVLNRPVMNLTNVIGYSWLLMNFAIKFFNKINYLDEVIFQISIVNVKDFALGGFGIKKKDLNGSTKYIEPYDSGRFRTPPLCKYNPKFKILKKFIVSEIKDENIIKEMMIDLGSKISRAFGEPVVKCFDDDGNFNSEGMNYFRR